MNKLKKYIAYGLNKMHTQRHTASPSLYLNFLDNGYKDLPYVTIFFHLHNVNNSLRCLYVYRRYTVKTKNINFR